MKNQKIFMGVLSFLMLFGFLLYFWLGGIFGKKANILSLKKGVLVVRTFDDTGEGIPIRAYVTGSDDSIYMANQSLPFNYKSVGHHFTTVNDSFTIVLPPGEATILLEKGKEYYQLKASVTITAGDTIRRSFKLIRWISMAKRGWFSGEHHVHRVGDAPILSTVEDLNFSLALTSWNGKDNFMKLGNRHLENADENGVVRIDSTHLVNFLGLELESPPSEDYARGLAVFYHLKERSKFPLPMQLQSEKARMEDFLDMASLAKRYGGEVELDKPIWKEAPIFVALANVDFMQIANNHFLREGYIPETGGWDSPSRISRTTLKQDYPIGEMGYALFTMDLYYIYLNAGFKIMPTAGSASYPIGNPYGYNRVYANIKGEITFKKWYEALKIGRSFVTNGPFIMLKAIGKTYRNTLELDHMDTVEFRVDSYSPFDLDKVEIILNGKIVKAFDKVHMRGDSTIITCRLPIDKSGWIVARTFHKKEDGEVQFGHTAPLFIDIKGRPFIPEREAVKWLIEQVESSINGIKRSKKIGEAEKANTLTLYKKAKAVYEKLLE